MWNLGPFSERHRAHRGRSHLPGACGPLRLFKKSCSSGQGHLPAPSITPGSAWVGWGKELGSHQGSVSWVQQANTDSDLAMWGEGYHRNNEAVLLALTLKPHNSISPCMSLAPPKPLSFHRPQGTCLSASSVPAGSLRECLLPSSLPSHLLWGLLFLALESWAGELVWGSDPSFPKGTSATEISLPTLNPTCECGAHQFYVSAPFTILDVASSCP